MAEILYLTSGINPLFDLMSAATAGCVTCGVALNLDIAGFVSGLR
jgi:hypothetical protein